MKRLALIEIQVDDEWEELCGRDCPGYGSDAEDDCTIFHADHDFYTKEGRAFRAQVCLSATALASSPGKGA